MLDVVLGSALAGDAFEIDFLALYLHLSIKHTANECSVAQFATANESMQKKTDAVSRQS